jgi:putative transposase
MSGSMASIWKVRLAQDKVCLLVMIGVRADGRKELIGAVRRHRVLG